MIHIFHRFLQNREFDIGLSVFIYWGSGFFIKKAKVEAEAEAKEGIIWFKECSINKNIESKSLKSKRLKVLYE